MNRFRPTSNRELRLLLLAFAVLGLAASPSQAVKRRAFVTSIAGSGNLASWPGSGGQTGLAGGDSICRARAAAGGLPNAATYRVWLSTSTTDAYCHVQGLSGLKSNGCDGAPQPGGGPWYLANGISNFTGTLAELTGPEGVMYRPVLMDENQAILPSPWTEHQVWTGSSRVGTALSTCGGWWQSSAALSGAVGNAFGAGPSWTFDSTQDCSQSRRLICFEPGVSETSILRWTPGAIVFVTSAKGSGQLDSWPEAAGATGVDAGDQICQTVAAAAQLPSPSSFVAWLSTTAGDARDRLTTNGPFRRIDGYTVAGNLLDLTDGATSNSLHVHEDGRYLTDAEDLVWTGTTGAGIAYLGYTCVDWSIGDNSAYGGSGGAGYARTDSWTDANAYVCSRLQRLYCISNVVTIFWDGFESGSSGAW